MLCTIVTQWPLWAQPLRVRFLSGIGIQDLGNKNSLMSAICSSNGEIFTRGDHMPSRAVELHVACQQLGGTFLHSNQCASFGIIGFVLVFGVALGPIGTAWTRTMHMLE